MLETWIRNKSLKADGECSTQMHRGPSDLFPPHIVSVDHKNGKPSYEKHTPGKPIIYGLTTLTPLYL